jgi:hypothetical protein
MPTPTQSRRNYTNANKKTLGLTDANGLFTIRIAKGSAVQFRFLGYTEQKQSILPPRPTK